MVYHAHVVCSEKPLLHSELNYLRSVFHKFNGYPYWFITKGMTEVKDDLEKRIDVKANHLAYGSRISSDCQQILLSPKHDTSGRF